MQHSHWTSVFRLLTRVPSMPSYISHVTSIWKIGATFETARFGAQHKQEHLSFDERRDVGARGCCWHTWRQIRNKFCAAYFHAWWKQAGWFNASEDAECTRKKGNREYLSMFRSFASTTCDTLRAQVPRYLVRDWVVVGASSKSHFALHDTKFCLLLCFPFGWNMGERICPWFFLLMLPYASFPLFQPFGPHR